MSLNTHLAAAVIPEQAAAASPSQPSPPPSADFDAAWDEAGTGLDSLGDLEQSLPQGPSMLNDIAQHQMSVLENAHAPFDLAALEHMSMIQVQVYMAQRKIDSNYATALLDTNWGVLKHLRQSIDTVMNSK